MPEETIRFGSLMIEFSDQVLRPRPWTIEQAAWAAELADTAPEGRLLELCSGAGQIGLALARLCSDRGRPRELVLVDADQQACRFARVNADRAGFGDSVEVREAPLGTALRPDESFPIIIADPPWVPTAGTDRYPEDPLWAIDGGPDGLAVARSCLVVISRHLQPGGSAVLQLGTEDQIGALADDLGAVDPGHALEVTEWRHPDGANGVLARLSRPSG